MGLELDGSGFGLGQRSQRYAAVIEDGVVRIGWTWTLHQAEHCTQCGSWLAVAPAALTAPSPR
jgi:peroxiredoxin